MKTMKKFISILLISMMMFSLIAVSGVSAADEIPWDKMIALYNMAGGIKDDVSGKDGLLVGGASIVQDAERGSVLFLDNPDGIKVVDDGAQWAELADHHIPDSDEMTISLWFYAKEYLEGAPRVFETGDARPVNEGDTVPLRFICIHPHRSSGDVGVQATLNCNDLTDIVPNNRDRAFSPADDTAVLDKWVHVVWVINKGKPNTMYVNGVAYQSTQGGDGDGADNAVFSPKDVLTAPEGTRNAFLGRSGEEGTAAVNPCFNGYLSDLSIFSVALGAGQVAELSKTDFSKGNPANVAAVVEIQADEVPGGEPVAQEAPAPVAVVAAPAPTPVAPRVGDTALPVFVLATVLAFAAITIKAKKAKN